MEEIKQKLTLSLLAMQWIKLEAVPLNCWWWMMMKPMPLLMQYKIQTHDKNQCGVLRYSFSPKMVYTCFQSQGRNGSRMQYYQLLFWLVWCIESMQREFHSQILGRCKKWFSYKSWCVTARSLQYSLPFSCFWASWCGGNGKSCCLNSTGIVVLVTKDFLVQNFQISVVSPWMSMPSHGA